MYGDEDYHAILDCAVRIGDMDYCPTIWLRRLGQDQYGRLYPWARKLLPPSSYGMPAYIEGYRPIFVREAPTYYGIPSFRVSPSNNFPLEDAFPLERWNPLTLTLQSEYSRRTELTGLFRLRDDTGGLFDVAVGLSKRRGFAWEAWCAQRRIRDDVSLEAAYDALQAEIRDKTLIRDKFSLADQSQQQFFWYSLQSLIGEDSQMFSEARVSDVTLQNRRYVWLSVIAKIEICTSRELDSIPQEVQELAISTNARYTKLLTSSYTRHSLDPPEKIGSQPYGVRCRPALDGKDLSRYGWTELHIAAAMGHAAAIRSILNHSAVSSASLVNSRTSIFLETPLHLLAGYAPADKQLDCFQALWGRSAGLAERNALEETPLHRAAAADCPQLIRAIPEFKRQVDYNDRWGRSPLWHAAAAGATAAIATLLDLGANINIMDDEGLTPLHAAARGGHDDAFQILLTRGARASARFDTQLFGLTPLHLAVLFGHRKCASLLL
ncbi:ankyrin repeat-containing domain protein, partial [Xylaria flabelliformis]